MFEFNSIKLFFKYLIFLKYFYNFLFFCLKSYKTFIIFFLLFFLSFFENLFFNDVIS